MCPNSKQTNKNTIAPTISITNGTMVSFALSWNAITIKAIRIIENAITKNITITNIHISPIVSNIFEGLTRITRTRVWLYYDTEVFKVR